MDVSMFYFFAYRIGGICSNVAVSLELCFWRIYMYEALGLVSSRVNAVQG